MSTSRTDLAPPAGCKYPDANVLVDGFTTPLARIPENAQNVRDRESVYFHTLNPQNCFHAWLVDDVGLMTLRLERCARIERRERDRIVLRAEHFWDDDRRAEAEELGARLTKNPARVVERLRRTPQGCDWLIRHWELLANEVERGCPWTEAHVSLAFDLLGARPDFRLDALDPRSVPAREIAVLRERRATVSEADALDRALAMADMSDQTSPELRRLRRHENALHKRMRWDLHQLQNEPKHHRPHPELRWMYEPEPSREPTHSIAIPSPTPEPDSIPEPQSTPEPAIQNEPIPARRPDPVLLKAQARRDAKKRRADRLDN